MRKVHISDMEYMLPADNIIFKVPYQKLFGRKT